MKAILRLAMAMLWSCAGLVSPLCADILYWDADGAGATGNPPTSGVGGTGTWNTNSAHWWNGSTYETWATGATADFRGALGTITLGETVSVGTIIANAGMSFVDSGAQTLDFSGSAGSFQREVSGNITLSTQIKAVDGFTFSSSFNNNYSINMGSGGTNEFSGTLNVNTYMKMFRNNMLGGAVGTAAHLNMNDKGLIEYRQSGIHGTFASITGTSGSRIFLDQPSFNGSLTLTGAGLTSSDVRTFSGTLDHVDAALISVIKQGSYTQAFDGGDKLTVGIDIQDGGMRFVGGFIQAPNLTLSDTATAQMYGGTTRVDTIVFSVSGGIMDFSGGTLALQGNWDLDALTLIENSTFTVQGEDSEVARSLLQFTSGSGDFTGYTLIIPEPGSLALILFGVGGLLFLRRSHVS